MAIFMGVHTVPTGTDDDKIKGAWDAYKASCEKHGIKATHAHFSAERGVAYCFTEANTKEEVEKAHEGLPVPLDDVFEVTTSK